MMFIRHTLSLLKPRTQLKPTTQLHLHFSFNSFYRQLGFSFALFRHRWRDKEFAITQQIKNSVTSQGLSQIIRKKGHLMNLVHLTAILDRMEQQQMVNTGQIVRFTVDRIRSYYQIFRRTDPDYIRTICNIICYLGNIKNRELNDLFRLVNFAKLIAMSKQIEKAMLITGLIRLELFSCAFAFRGDTTRAMLFQDVIARGFRLNHLLSIWFAVVNQPQINARSHIHSVFQELINAQVQRQQLISYREYTYAAICYTSAFSHLKNPKSGQLYNLVHYQMPSEVKNGQYLLPHELCLLLTSLKTLSSKEIKVFVNKIKTSGLEAILLQNFRRVSGKGYTTLRHIASNFKLINEMFEMDIQTFLLVLAHIKLILKEQTLFLQKQQNYQMNNKVDSLSLCSLTWKINQFLFCRKQEVQDFKPFIELNQSVFQFVVQLGKLAIFQRFSVQELLMLYSGVYTFARIRRIQLSEEFKQISIKTVMKPLRPLTLKQHTLFYAYFKKMQIFSPSFCRFTKQNVDKLCATSTTANQTALKIWNEKSCIMGLKERCLNCLSQTEKPNQGSISDQG